MIGRRFSAGRWLADYQAAGGRLVIVGAAAFTFAPIPSRRAERLEQALFADRRRWVAVYQLAAALGPAPRRI